MGKDLHFWLKVLGVDTFPFWRFGKTAPSSGGVIDLGDYKERLARGIRSKVYVYIFYTDGVVWPDGKKEPIDTVILQRAIILISLTSVLLEHWTRKETLTNSWCKYRSPRGLLCWLRRSALVFFCDIKGVGSDAKFVVRKLISYLKI